MPPPGYDQDNIFAKILRGEIPSYKVYETAHCVAILDAFPVVRYHVLVLPKAPTADASDLDEVTAAAVFRELPRLIRAVKAASGSPSVKVVSNAGHEAGQEVFHTHVHLIPCFSRDQSMRSASSMVDKDEAMESVRVLQSHL